MKSLFAFLLLLPVLVHGQVITTIANGNIIGFSGDGGPSTSAAFNGIRGVAVDGKGNVFVSDINNLRVRRIATDGIITTIAGNGTPGYVVNGIPATTCSFYAPTFLAADTFGRVYIYDSLGYTVTVVDTSGNIYAVAGNGLFGYSGDYGYANMAAIVGGGLSADDSMHVYITASANNKLRKAWWGGSIMRVAGIGTGGYSGDGGPALAAEMDKPSYTCTEKKGGVLISDTYNNAVRRMDTAGNMYTVAGEPLAGGGYNADEIAANAAMLNLPAGVAKAENGKIYIADRGNNRIRMIDGVGIIHTICGNGTPAYSGDNGPATAAQIDSPTAICVDLAQNVYFLDQGNNRVRKISGITGNYNLCIGATTTFTAGLDGTWASSNTAVATVAASGAVTAVTVGTAIITYAKGGVLATAVVTVNPLPAAITGPLTICAGISSALSCATPGGTWVSSNVSVAIIGSLTGYILGSTAGGTTISYILPTGCRSTASVVVNPLPVAGAISGPNSICPGETVRLISVSSAGAWTSEDPAIATVSTTGFVTGVAPGTVLISYTASNSCGAAETDYTVTVRSENCPVSVPGLTAGMQQPVIFPDPADKLVTIAVPAGMSRLVICNVLGKTVYDKPATGRTADVDISLLPTGMYFVLVNGARVGKFLKR